MTYEFYKEVALTVFIAGVIAVCLGAGIAWLAFDMDRHAQTIQKSLAEIQARKDAEGNLVLLRGQAGQASGYVPFLVSILPDPDSLISLPRDLTAKARLYGIDFGFTFGASTKGATTTAGTIAYTMSGKGPADKWIDFLRAVESGNPLASIERAVFTSTDGKLYETKINGTIFSQ
ncbi:MAG: hypothetical protein EXS60_01545 [Candidatus Pacebacteria bacterium]|nr:hypothetical protein [Candidatus Paceibacterota bacterium]